jgi:hypothetical protein
MKIGFGAKAPMSDLLSACHDLGGGLSIRLPGVAGAAVLGTRHLLKAPAAMTDRGTGDGRGRSVSPWR